MSIPILTIGGAGFISSRFTDELMQDSCRIYAPDSRWRDWRCPAGESGVRNDRRRALGLEPYCCFPGQVGGYYVHFPAITEL